MSLLFANFTPFFTVVISKHFISCYFCLYLYNECVRPNASSFPT